MLATYFLQKYGAELGSQVEGISSEAIKLLSGYRWPGNVRELENEVKRALVLSSGKLVEVEDLSESIRNTAFVPPPGEVQATTTEVRPLKDRVTALEIQMIREAMTQANGDRRRAAKFLGLSHQGLINKVKRYGLE